jgi:cobaltochelatase CobN
VVEVPRAAARTPEGRQKYLRCKAEDVLRPFVFQRLSAVEALRAAGCAAATDRLPQRLRDGFGRARQLQEGFAATHQELDNLLAALAGRFIPPGPGNSPDRNPGVVPTGRNMYVMNPEEVPSPPSWEIGKQLVEQLLSEQLKSKGRYPRKVAFTLNSFATFQDYGVMESQILYLLGVRPVWDDRHRVLDVELIPTAQLGRPRIDVFISALGYYRDMLPTRMRLLDKAVRLVAALDEPGNQVYRNSVEVRKVLQGQGIDSPRAEALSRARIFGAPPGQIGSAGYYYLVERSGQWGTRDDLLKTYLGYSRYVYTESLWGHDAPEAYDRQIQGSEVLLRSWSDRTRSPLSNKYDWYVGGSLSLAIRKLTGQEPEWFLSDVRDPDRATLRVAEDALARDYRVRLFNRKWIEGMMREGYAGADQIAIHVSNTMGWKIMRQQSVSDETWNEIAAIYVRDKLGLSVRQWFEAENPFAFQDMSEVLLESSRKGYWKAEPGMLREVAERYARSVVRHGEGGGLRGGGNQQLEQFVAQTLKSAPTAELAQLAAQYEDRLKEAQAAPAAVAPGTAPGPGAAGATGLASAAPAKGFSGPASAKVAAGSASAAPVPHGARKLEPVAAAVPADGVALAPPVALSAGSHRWRFVAAIAAVSLLLVAGGALFRRGVP